MPTPAQEAFAEGFAELAAVHATVWAFGGVAFSGVASALMPDDPRLIGSKDRLLSITAHPASVPPGIRVGSELTRGGRNHRVVRIPELDTSTGLTSILVVA